MGRAAARRSVGKGLGWLLVELIVVFVGVYAAFVLDDYREQKRVETKKSQVYAALLEEFGAHAAALDTIASYVDGFAADFRSEHDAGAMPRPGHVHLMLGIRSGLWDAVLKAGGLDVLDVGVMYRINTYYSFARFIAGEMERLTALSDQFLLPAAEEDIEWFYDIRTRKLKKTYGWYVTTLEAIGKHMLNLRDMTEDLIADLEEQSR